MVGILTQMSFHSPKGSINYYAGAEITGPVPPRLADRVFTVGGGKYARFSTNASYHDFWELMMQFKIQWLDRNPYLIREIFALEDISPENRKADYPCLQRTVYIPIRPK
jgi:DNA gyrase inhibitor GyrI